MAAKAERHATAHWQGNLPQGSGTVSFGSGAISEQKLSWAARTEAPGGLTSPEELLAGAQAGCYAMAFAHTLAQNGTPAQSLTVNTTCTFAPQPAAATRSATWKSTSPGMCRGWTRRNLNNWPDRRSRAAPSPTPFATTSISTSTPTSPGSIFPDSERGCQGGGQLRPGTLFRPGLAHTLAQNHSLSPSKKHSTLVLFYPPVAGLPLNRLVE